jgi:hypothetical protein
MFFFSFSFFSQRPLLSREEHLIESSFPYKFHGDGRIQWKVGFLIASYMVNQKTLSIASRGFINSPPYEKQAI